MLVKEISEVLVEGIAFVGLSRDGEIIYDGREDAYQPEEYISLEELKEKKIISLEPTCEDFGGYSALRLTVE